MDGAINNGYYGAFTIQVHSDEPADAPGRNALIAAAMTRGVPVVSARQILTWLDGRNSSTFQNVQFGTDGKLRFTVVPGAGANGLEAMIPIQGRSGDLSTLTRNGQSVSYQTQTIKGITYAVLPDASGDYVATYPAPATAPPATAAPPGGGTTGGGSTVGTTGSGSTGGTTGGGTTGGSSGAAGTTRSGNSTSGTTTKRRPFLTASAATFRPGSKRKLTLTVRLSRDSRARADDPQRAWQDRAPDPREPAQGGQRCCTCAGTARTLAGTTSQPGRTRSPRPPSARKGYTRAARVSVKVLKEVERHVLRLRRSRSVRS